MKPTLTVYAAGSLRHAFADLLNDFGESRRLSIDVSFGPAGLLRQKIERGDKVDLFASANCEHPRALFAKGLATEPRYFAANSLGIVMRNIPELTSQSWLSALLDEQFTLGMSTPGCDPSGDYTLRLFDSVELLHPGYGERLRRKAQSLVGGEASLALPKDVLPAVHLIRSGRADIFIGYTNNNSRLQGESDLFVMQVPSPYAVRARYELCVMNGALEQADDLAEFIMSATGQRYLQTNGFQLPE